MPYKDPIKQKEYFRNRLKKMFTNKCLDCGRSVFKRAKRCKSCSKKKEYRNPHIRQKRWAKKVNGVYLQSLAPRIRDLKEYSQWRIDVFRRDGFVCQICNERGKLLHAHHIKKMSNILIEENIDSIEKAIICKVLWELNNGITLCVPCHKKVHNENII